MSFETLFHAYIHYFHKNYIINTNLEYELCAKKLKPFGIQETYTFIVSNYVRADKITSSAILDGMYIFPKKINSPTFDSVFRGKVKKGSIKKNREVVFFFRCTVGEDGQGRGIFNNNKLSYKTIKIYLGSF
jgi:hypothetical protein